MNEKIFIASDHAGFDLKKQILNSIKANLIDLGVDSKIVLTILIMQKNLFQKLKLLKIQKEFLFVVQV